MIKKIFVLGLLSFFSLMGVAQAESVKVYVCHLTSSDTNPAVLIYVPVNAADVMLGGGDYLLPEGQTTCNGDGPVIPPEII